jgi:uncharacterized alkaline shock family protein YloU/adenylate kinase family enzyme
MYKYAISIKSFFHHLSLFFKGIKVFALIGKSGTGKSFRAQLVAQRFSINIIIDDGLAIKDQRILAGKSAKKEKKKYTAVKTALFYDEDHARNVIDSLKTEDFKKILIVGTSEKMTRIIAYRLGLPEPSRIIRIEDIATQEEIDAASRSRKISGKHIIPVPAIEVKREHSHIFLNSVQVFLRRNLFFWKSNNTFEKTLVRPEYSEKGTVKISESAVSQMVIHCVKEYNPELEIMKIVVSREEGAYRLEIIIRVPFGMRISGRLHGLQLFILESIEQFTGLDLNEVNVTVGAIAKPEKRGWGLLRALLKDEEEE